MHGPAFLTDKDVTQVILLEDGIVDRQYRAAGISEQNVYTLVDQSFDEYFGAGHAVLGHGIILQQRASLSALVPKWLQKLRCNAQRT